jgi:hypothetical protein
MPYIARRERPAIDGRVEQLAEEISSMLARETNRDTGVSVHYRRSFVDIAKVLVRLARGRAVRGKAHGAETTLALEIFGLTGEARRERGAWAGRLNYALTRLIQVVPEKMVERGAWREEFRYWVYAQTVGALTRSAFDVNAMGDDWPVDTVVGVLTDVKDEYKRRVNAAYETFQIKKAGDCYDTRYRTELSEIKDITGRVIGYADIMKDRGTEA